VEIHGNTMEIRGNSIEIHGNSMEIRLLLLIGGVDEVVQFYS
jgi:hypothetical protein